MSQTINKDELKKTIVFNVKSIYRKTIDEATPAMVYQAVALAVKDMIIDRWIATHKEYDKQDAKIVYYMSMEFLTGRFLGNNIISLCEQKEIEEALSELGFDLNSIEDQERDPALGNGGLGRLAACFLDSLASLGYPAYGCGIRYRYGMFKQQIRDGYQIEVPDEWLKDGYPFEIRRAEYATEVKFGGYVETEWDGKRNHFVQKGYQSVMAVPYDIPIVGYGNNVVNSLRIWDAQPVNTFNLSEFDKGDYQKAVEQENLAKTIVEVLYPNDNHYSGKELRLKQQYFFISASVQRAIKKYKEKHDDIHKFYEKASFQLNDTHPTVAVAELMRILLDEENLEWDEAWEITTKTCAYTNHTIMAEALEKWPIELFSRLLPRVYQIVEEINRRFVAQIQQRYPGDNEKIRRMAIIYDGQVRMAYLAIVGSFSVNGVAKLHTEILEKQELRDFYEMMPEKFNNKTNGITFRRWLLHSNHELTGLISSKIGDGFKKDANELEKLMQFKDDEAVLKAITDIKMTKKKEFKDYLLKKENIEIDENSIIDVQVKRLHEYKRQQMNALYIIHKYMDIKAGNKPARPITFVFGAKAAPAYTIAKDIIHLILCLSKVIENDPEVSPYLKVVMLENYNVTYAEKIIPAADISEQISLASKEASGTSNMKFMLNGAVTLGTEDGANVEIHELVGDDNIYIFGEKSDTVIEHYAKADYSAEKIYDEDPEIAKLVDFIIDKKMFAVGNKKSLIRLYMEIVTKDWFMTLLDIKDYIRVKEQVFKDYEDRAAWSRKMIKNIAMAGFFSSDRTIAQYNDDIWHLD